MTNEYAANTALATTQATTAQERARWASVLAPTVKTMAQRRAVRKSLLSRILGL